jgi:hypothetical protein
VVKRLNLRSAFVAFLLISFPLPRAFGLDRPEGNAARLLDDLGHKAFRWFQDNRNPRTGLVRDRAPNWKGRTKTSDMASIASLGYYLSLLPEAVRLGEITRAEAEANAVLALRFVSDKMHHEHGLLYHFTDWETGKRWDKCEISVLDTSIFFNGCIVAAEAFGGEVADLANRLADRADWPHFLVNHHKTGKKVLSFGWKPEEGLLGAADFRSSEIAMPYFLAVGSRTHPIDAECWYNTPLNYGNLCGYKILNPGYPLFTSYYGLAWHDLKGMSDRTGVDLEANARLAALANRAFCRTLAGKFRSCQISEGSWWGISAGDSPKGYIGPALVATELDGTLWPTAALAALPSIPRELEQDLMKWRASKTWQRVSGDYGLSPFNLDKEWVGDDLIGIDIGSFYLSLANYRNGTIWKLWMKHPVAVNAFRRLGIKTPKLLTPSASRGLKQAR